MNAGRDVERLIADWLTEEAEVRAPDRVLESARLTIDRTLQRRWVAAWREPVTITMTRLAALAAALAIALGAAAWVGRASAPDLGGMPSMTAAPTSSPGATPPPTLEAYRAARDEICVRYRPLLNPLKPELDRLYDPTLPAAERADKTAALTKIRDTELSMIRELAAIPAPPEIAADNATQLAAANSMYTLINEVLGRLAERKYTEAQAMDLATDPFAREIEAFESKYDLLACP